MPEIQKVNISLYYSNEPRIRAIFSLLWSAFQMISAVLENSLLATCTCNAKINFHKTTINSKFKKKTKRKICPLKKM